MADDWDKRIPEINDLLISKFDRLDVSYKEVNGKPITTAILIPRSPSSNGKPVPILADIHGGGLVMGTNPEPAFLARWVIDLVEEENAIWVCPAYRLIPEATTGEILDDIDDFWKWVHQPEGLQAAVHAVKPNLTVDLDRVALHGESAGGFLSLQSAFLFPHAKMKVAMAHFPIMYTDLQHEPLPLRSKDVPPGSEQDAFIDKYLKDLSDNPGAVRTSSPWPEMTELMFATFNTGRLKSFLGNDERMTLRYVLSQAKDVPPLWVAQGIQDTIVSKESTDEVVAAIREAHPDTPLKYTVEDGEHGFGADLRISEPWMAEGVAFVRQYW